MSSTSTAAEIPSQAGAPERVPAPGVPSSVAGRHERTLADTVHEFLCDGQDVAFSQRRNLRRASWTYEEVARGAFQFARELERRGIAKGDRIVIWGENCGEWVTAFYGCILRGAVVVPLDRDSAPDFVGRVCEQVQPKLLVASFARPRELATLPVLKLESVREVIAGHAADPYQETGMTADDLVEIVFTSGTTGTPKGVQLTHRNIFAVLDPIAAELRTYRRWERFVHPLRVLSLPPLSHVFGQLTGLFVPPVLRCEVVFLDSMSPGRIIETVKRRRITAIAAVPRVLRTLQVTIEREREDRGQLARLRERLEAADTQSVARRWWQFRSIHRQFGPRCWALITGGATLDPETELFWSRLGFAVIQGYGMTETSALVSLNFPFRTSRGSIGEVLPGQEVRLGEGGEILVRGGNVTPGYWGRTQGGEWNDGWFRTGDLGEMDATGRLYFTGRKKDVIVTSAGLKVHPDDLERALNQQPEIVASAVVGIDGQHGPEPVAALIVRGDAQAADVAVARANAALADFQQIRRWLVWPDADFPRTPTQKVRKPVVADYILRHAGTGRAEAKTASPLAALIERAGGEPTAQLGPEARLGEDLKLDSLGRVQLLGEIEERFQVDVDEGAFTAAATVGDIERMLQKGAAEVRPMPYPYWSLSGAVNVVRAIFYGMVVLPMTALLCWPRIQGAAQLARCARPALFISNHQTPVDPVLIMAALPWRFRRRLAIAMIGEWLSEWRHGKEGRRWLPRMFYMFVYWLAVTFFNVFSLPQESGFRRSFEYAGDAVDRGYSVLVFPEGALTTDGEIHAFQSGIGLLAAQLGIPVVPLRVTGLYDLKAARRFVARPYSVGVSVGAPVTFSAHDDPQAIADDLEHRVRELATNSTR